MSFFKKKVLGVDIGTDSIKVVEVSFWGKSKKLENYGELKSSLVSKDLLLQTNEKGELVSSDLLSEALKEILKEARIKTKKVIFSLPDFVTFAASFEIPPMSQKEIPGAIYYNASRYLTLPVSEVTLDWKVLPNGRQNKNSAIKVFLIAVPNQVVREYQKIAKSAGLELCALESEVFGLARVLVGSNQSTVCIIDMGAKTSTISIIDNGHIKSSYSSSFNSSQLPDNSAKEKLSGATEPVFGQFFSEIKNIWADFSAKEQKQISALYLTGGAANVSGLRDYFSQNFNKPVVVSNCFENFAYPKILKESLFRMSPRFSVAVGVATGILEI